MFIPASCLFYPHRRHLHNFPEQNFLFFFQTFHFTESYTSTTETQEIKAHYVQTFFFHRGRLHCCWVLMLYLQALERSALLHLVIRKESAPDTKWKKRSERSRWWINFLFRVLSTALIGRPASAVCLINKRNKQYIKSENQNPADRKLVLRRCHVRAGAENGCVFSLIATRKKRVCSQHSVDYNWDTWDVNGRSVKEDDGRKPYTSCSGGCKSREKGSFFSFISSILRLLVSSSGRAVRTLL